MEPFCMGLEISKYVEYLTRISSKYFTSSVLPSLISTADRTSRVLLAYMIPSYAIYSTHHTSLAVLPLHKEYVQCHATTNLEVRKLYCAVNFVSAIEAWKPVTIEVESRSHTPLLQLRHRY
jgi:hypothetical protein